MFKNQELTAFATQMWTKQTIFAEVCFWYRSHESFLTESLRAYTFSFETLK